MQTPRDPPQWGPFPSLPASPARSGKEWSAWSLLRAGVPERVPLCVSDSHGESQAPPDRDGAPRQGRSREEIAQAPSCCVLSCSCLPSPVGYTQCCLQGSASQGTARGTTPWYPYGVQEATFLYTGLLGWGIEREDEPRKAEEVGTRL